MGNDGHAVYALAARAALVLLLVRRAVFERRGPQGREDTYPVPPLLYQLCIHYAVSIMAL
eukprot:7391505-Prymnesium_polylepis.1